jgi:hypothetical protein
MSAPTDSTKPTAVEIFATTFIKLENCARYAKEINELRDVTEVEAALAFVAFVKAIEPFLTEIAKLEGNDGLRILGDRKDDIRDRARWLTPIVAGELRLAYYDPLELKEVRVAEAERTLARFASGWLLGPLVEVTENCNYAALHSDRVYLDAVRTLRTNSEAMLKKRA